MTDDPNDRTLTVDDIYAAYDHPDWVGYGFLGARRAGLRSPRAVEVLDRTVLDEARKRLWTRGQFFDWMNSKRGRWAAEQFFDDRARFYRDLQTFMVLP